MAKVEKESGDLRTVVECPNCNAPSEIFYNEETNLPGFRNGCLTICDECGMTFCLISTEACEGCNDFLSGENCAMHSFIDAPRELRKAGLIGVQLKLVKGNVENQ